VYTNAEQVTTQMHHRVHAILINDETNSIKITNNDDTY